MTLGRWWCKLLVMSEEHHEEESLQGSEASLGTWEDRVAAVEQAFDYRGDVTILTTEGKQIIGYVFDRQCVADGAYLRVMLPDDGERVVVRYDELAKLEFSGKDTAAGKSWEAWVKRQDEKKQ